jgi:hypothetical protein
VPFREADDDALGVLAANWYVRPCWLRRSTFRAVIAYYEAQTAQPPGALLIDLVKPVRETLSPRAARLLKRLRRLEELPPADQRAVSSSSTPCSKPAAAPRHHRQRGSAKRADMTFVRRQEEAQPMF